MKFLEVSQFVSVPFARDLLAIANRYVDPDASDAVFYEFVDRVESAFNGAEIGTEVSFEETFLDGGSIRLRLVELSAAETERRAAAAREERRVRGFTYRDLIQVSRGGATDTHEWRATWELVILDAADEVADRVRFDANLRNDKYSPTLIEDTAAARFRAWLAVRFPEPQPVGPIENCPDCGAELFNEDTGAYDETCPMCDMSPEAIAGRVTRLLTAAGFEPTPAEVSMLLAADKTVREGIFQKVSVGLSVPAKKVLREGLRL